MVRFHLTSVLAGGAGWLTSERPLSLSLSLSHPFEALNGDLEEQTNPHQKKIIPTQVTELFMYFRCDVNKTYARKKKKKNET